MNYDILARQIREKHSLATDAELFRYFVTLLQDSQYGWSGENLFGPDCSGTVAFGLFGAGFNVRLTADQYYRLLFTNVPGKSFDEQDILAVFYRATTDRKHGDRVVAAGTITHVTPIVGEDTVLDAAWGKRARLRSVARAEILHRGFATEPVLRSVDWTKLDNLHKSGLYLVDDKELIALST